MQKVYVRTHGKNTSLEFKPEVPLQKAPGIEREYRHLGTRMYKTTDGRSFDADTYDRNFKVDKGKMLPKGTKGSMSSSAW